MKLRCIKMEIFSLAFLNHGYFHVLCYLDGGNSIFEFLSWTWFQINEMLILTLKNIQE